VDPAQYQPSDFGQATREPGDKRAFWYFMPTPIPQSLTLDAATVVALSEADSALGLLEGLGRLVRDPQTLIGPSLRREALASSRIEGTQASLSDVLRAEVGAAGGEDTAEVERYLAAAKRGYDLMERLPITGRMIRELHEILLRGGRGQTRTPGEFRRSPVWVGAAGETLDNARFVPPPPGQLSDLMADWEKFVNQPSPQPPLIRCALMHYQFETIHPFLDGNGRIGRLLINLMLVQEKRLTIPLLYVSGYLEANRRDYYDRLQAVRERGDIQGWLDFFLRAVRGSAADAVARAGALIELREAFLADAASARSRLPRLINPIIDNPYLTVDRISRELGLSTQGARNLIRQAQEKGWVSEVGTAGRGGRMYWLADRVLTAMEQPPSH
jgi:Fic family protein